MNTNVVLKFNTGESKGETITFSNHETVTVGRDEQSCKLIIPESYKTVSRNHCSLTIDAPFVIVSDLNSKNGTWINEHKIGEAAIDFAKTEDIKNVIKSTNDFLLKPGDKLILGGEKNKNGKVEIEGCELELEYVNLNDYFETVKDCIDEGRMGVVKLVKDKDVETKSLMAVKVLKNKIKGVSEDNMIRIKDWFVREFYNGRQLSDHDNVVNYYHLGSYNARPAIVMEYCPGGSLEKLFFNRIDDNIEYMKSIGKKIDLATKIIFQVFDALDYMHNKAEAKVALADNRIYITTGMVHRDIRPDNILLMDDSLENPVVKIVDLGFTKTFWAAGKSNNTYPDEACGDWSYVPKQQAQNYLYSQPKVDVWATFASCYRMLVGVPPKGFIPENGRQQVIKKRAVDIRVYNPDIPKKLAEVINNALIDDPDIIVEKASKAKVQIMNAL